MKVVVSNTSVGATGCSSAVMFGRSKFEYRTVYFFKLFIHGGCPLLDTSVCEVKTLVFQTATGV